MERGTRGVGGGGREVVLTGYDRGGRESETETQIGSREHHRERGGGERETDRDRQREKENSNSNSKTLFYKDCSLGSFKNLSNN